VMSSSFFALLMFRGSFVENFNFCDGPIKELRLSR